LLLLVTPAYSFQSTSADSVSVAAQSFADAGEPAAADALDEGLYADGTRAIHESRWSDAAAIFTKVASGKGDHADAALYWKAYAENKQGESSRALDTCAELRREFPKSRWMDECGALEIEIRGAGAKPVQPQAEHDEDLKLLALNSLMKQDEPRALSEIQPILNGDHPEAIKERALFIVAQGQSKQAQELLKQLASENSNPTLQAKATEMVANLHGKQTGSPGTDPQATSAPGAVTVSMVVTVEGRHGAEIPNIGAENVSVNESRARAKLTGWVPLQGDRAGLELFVLVDDSVSSSRGTQLDDIRHFMMAQPATTKIGVAYLQEGGTRIIQSLTTDHALAADALHVTLGQLAKTASPYVALADLIKRWPAGSQRREILMISNGVDSFFGQAPDRDNPYVDSAVEEAQRAGIIVFTINNARGNPSLNADRIATQEIGSSGGSDAEPGHGNLDRARAAGGRNYLSEVADETGGESYHQESGAPISFAPYLEDATRRLQRQYLLTFVAKPEKKAGMQAVKVRVDAPHAEVVSAERVYVPATQ
jgi:hypothetical protein